MTLTPLRLLIIDDSGNDAELIIRALKNGGFATESTRVAPQREFAQALSRSPWDVVITDHALPDTNPIEVLELVKSTAPDTSVIIVSGHIGEEVAVAAMRAGAHDCVMKENLSQLAPVVRRALAESRMRTENRQTAELLKDSHAQLEKANQTLKENQAMLVQTEKMASLGQIAAGIAHELKNPLAYVMGNLGTLKDYLDVFTGALKLYEKLSAGAVEGSSDDLRGICKEIREFKATHNFEHLLKDLTSLIQETQDGTESIADLVQRIKIFSHNDDKRLPYDLNECIETALKLTSHELKMKCQVRRELDRLPLVTCDPARMSQVFMNLFINAAHAIPKFGTVTVSAKHADKRVEISVRDDGEGISPEHMPRLFDSFFTTKPHGQGTGLGLSIVQRIVKDHHGNIKVKSSPGEGATFTVELPVG